MSNKGNKPKQGRKGMKRALIIVAATAAALVLIVAGTAYGFSLSVSSNSIPIVTNAPEASLAPTPVPSANLPIITGEPADIGEDVDEPVPTSTSSGSGTNPVQPTAVPIYQKVPITKNVINILIIGQDIRPNQTGNGRSDTMMILSYNRKDGKASIVSFMRDTWVPIHGYDWNRLNATFAFGGAGLTINTINELFDLDIQDYIIVNFDGMKDLVDKIGGVDVAITNVESAYYSREWGLNIPAGITHLDGQQALTHARNRKSNGGDFERVRRQQDVMLAIYLKMRQIRDPVVLANLTGFMMQNIKTNIAADTLFSLGLEIVDKGTITIQRGRMPADKTWNYANKDGRSVITIDFTKNKKYIHQLIYDSD